ncbi:histidine-specific methyltransferase [Epithele typhae]|uniref:histidine-specific methyltransferase n=1 Tax=Epithele typhae TaxID=378194 RepID=UPI0020081387|nr:histidine-specific methyltransferase [Epithele typhae]KAH9931672.1 histidine-specific methyltransferase [Epithele typhae]
MALDLSNRVDIIDMRARQTPSSASVRDDILAGLNKPVGEKQLPTLLLYDEVGLQIYDEITTNAKEYYLFPAEEEILKNKADTIVKVMHSANPAQDSLEENVVELGAGALRKTSLILRALSRQVPEPFNTPPINYYALDLEKRELERVLMEVNHSDMGPELQGKVSTNGLCGTYDEGLKFIEDGGLYARTSLNDIDTSFTAKYPLEPVARDVSPSSDSSDRSRTVPTEGTEATPPLTPSVQTPLHILFLGSSLGNFTRGEDARFLKSLPLRPGSGNTLLLGLDHGSDGKQIEAAYNDSNGITRKFIMNGLTCAGRALGDEKLFEQDKWEYVGRYNEELRRHEAYYRSTCDQTVVDPGSKASFPFVKGELVRVEVSNKFSERDAYALFTEANLRPVHRWTDSSSQYSLWLLERPRFSFPLLTSPGRTQDASRSPFSLPTIDEWRHMWAAWDFITREMIPQSMMFEKPIDLRHICLFYCGHIPTFLSIHLARLLKEPGTEPVEFKRGIDPIVDDPTQCHPHSEVPLHDEDWPSLRSIWEFQARVRTRVHDLYDDIESGKVTLTRKIARVLYMTLEHEAFHAEPETPAVTLGPATLSMGHDDDEADDDSTEVLSHDFGWDNEHPKRTVQVERFRIEWRPVTNGQFFDFYVKEGGKDLVQLPKSWVEIDGEILVRAVLLLLHPGATLYGPVPMKIARNWPFASSYDHLSKYATVKGGRIPTEPELRLFMDKFECGYEGGANIGFRNWHPIPRWHKDGGKGHNGGLWEWTSSVLEKYDGFVPSKLYPGYSTDFFDTHHQVVIGGSYATIPRLAERRTVRNYYQHNTPTRAACWRGGDTFIRPDMITSMSSLDGGGSSSAAAADLTRVWSKSSSSSSFFTAARRLFITCSNILQARAQRRQNSGVRRNESQKEDVRFSSAGVSLWREDGRGRTSGSRLASSSSARGLCRPIASSHLRSNSLSESSASTMVVSSGP